MQYKRAKEYLYNAAMLIKEQTDDKPMIRQYINDVCDSIVKDTINCPSFDVSDKKREQYANWLHGYAATLHESNRRP